MLPKLKYFNVNWENGMKLNKNHFIQQENAFNDKLKDIVASFINDKNYGLLPTGIAGDTSSKVVLKIDNQSFLQATITECRAITPGGARIEIVGGQLQQDIKISLVQEIEKSKNNGNARYFVLLTTDIFRPEPFGEVDAEEGQPYSMIIGKLDINSGKPELHDDYIPPCTSLRSHPQLLSFFHSTEKFFGQLELDLLSIIKKIREKGQDSNLAKSVLELAQNMLSYLSQNQLKLHWHLTDLPPIYLFEFIATSARVIHNAIDSLAAASKEEMLNYFTNWSELKQGDFEKLLVYCINFDYKHYEILDSVEQFAEFIQIVETLFTKLESLAYIGKKKETNIFVKEHKSRRSFLAD